MHIEGWVLGGIIGLLVGAAGTILLLRQQQKVRTRHLKLASSELQKSEERYRTLAKISPVGVFRTDPNGAMTYVNPKWCEISGFS
jgi:PAS domain-containing protein